MDSTSAGGSEHGLPPTMINVPDQQHQSSQKALMLQHYYLELYAHEVHSAQRRRRSSASSTASSSSSLTLDDDTIPHNDQTSSPSNNITTTAIDSMAYPVGHSRSKPALRTADQRASTFALISSLPTNFSSSSRSSSIAPIPEDAILESPRDLVSSPTSTDERQALDTHADLKSTLTALLNCETVRHDERMRAWVQSQLMDAEHELRRHRRRRVIRYSSVSSESTTMNSSNTLST